MAILIIFLQLDLRQVQSFYIHACFVQFLEAPEEEHDPRSLYDRLQEQKDKKQQEYEENYKLSMFTRFWSEKTVKKFCESLCCFIMFVLLGFYFVSL